VNLPSSERISVLDEMRFLRRRDGVEASDLMRMATVNGAVGLGVEAGAVGLGVGDRPAGVIAVDVGGVEGWERDPLDAVMRGDAQPRWVYRGG
jgi:cytosine/adenosine deaminase-related metal-dependent hydrolase